MKVWQNTDRGRTEAELVAQDYHVTHHGACCPICYCIWYTLMRGRAVMGSGCQTKGCPNYNPNVEKYQ